MDVRTWEVNPDVLFGSFVSDPTEDLHGEWVPVKETRNPRPAKKTHGLAKQVKKKKAKVINFNIYVCLFEGSIHTSSN